MLKSDVFVSNKNWNKYIKKPDQYINQKLKKINKKSNMFKKVNLKFSLLLSNNSEVKNLNKRFRNKNKTTDVLSFPFLDKKNLNKIFKEKKEMYIGDVIVNLSEIIKQGKETSFILAFDKIWIHGFLHLIGYRHRLNKDFIKMQKLENKLINLL
ncbi:MAG: rRNA maturation RNase YbeY [Pelagibacteraceae bacterium]